MGSGTSQKGGPRKQSTARAPDKATDRLLTVFEVIAKRGPLPLAELTRVTGLPRSAVHRAAQVLQRRGWVRARLSDHAYAVSSRFDDAIADARYSHEDAEALAPVMTRLAERWSCNADLALFVARGVFEVVDSTDRSAELGRRSLTASGMAIAAQVALPPTGRVRHLEAFLTQARDDEAEFVTSGGHFRQMKAAEAQVLSVGALTDGGAAVLAPFMAPSGVAGTMRLRPRRTALPQGALLDLRVELDKADYRLTQGL